MSPPGEPREHTERASENGKAHGADSRGLPLYGAKALTVAWSGLRGRGMCEVKICEKICEDMGFKMKKFLRAGCIRNQGTPRRRGNYMAPQGFCPREPKLEPKKSQDDVVAVRFWGLLDSDRCCHCTSVRGRRQPDNRSPRIRDDSILWSLHPTLHVPTFEMDTTTSTSTDMYIKKGGREGEGERERGRKLRFIGLDVRAVRALGSKCATQQQPTCS